MAATNPSYIIPPPPPVATTNDIRGIKPPVMIPNDWAWVWWLLAAMVLLALLIVAWRWWHKERTKPEPVMVIPPHVRARQRLAEALLLISDPRAFCIRVSDTLRVYLEERFEFHAPERTTEEFLIELRATTLLTSDQKQSLGEFLRSCDLVKFARFEPAEVALRELHDGALRLVDETQFDPINTASPASAPPPVPNPPETLTPSGARGT